MEVIHESFQQQHLQSSIEDLPDEVVEFIFGFLPPYKDLQNCMIVSRRWYNCAQNVLHKTSTKLVKAVGEFNILWKNLAPVEMTPTITRRFSHSACVYENNMYVFGGCTTNATSFNDLWRFDLSRRRWIRPLATGTYPVPKAYTSMVQYKNFLIVFGGWTYPSSSQYYQNVTMYNEIHFYCLNTNKWILINTHNSPPPMAGHSACIKGDEMIIFGGLVMSADQNYQIQCSNDIWILHIPTAAWRIQATTKLKPQPRYSHSVISLEYDKFMVLGGVQTLHNRFIYNDCWMLTMQGPVWTWKELAVKNKEWAASNIWCNPACRVGDKVVSLSRARNGWNSPKPLVTSAVRITGVNRNLGPPVSMRVEKIIQRPLDRDQNINGKRGVLPRLANSVRQAEMNQEKEPIAGPSHVKTFSSNVNMNSKSNDPSCCKFDNNVLWRSKSGGNSPGSTLNPSAGPSSQSSRSKNQGYNDLPSPGPSSEAFCRSRPDNEVYNKTPQLRSDGNDAREWLNAEDFSATAGPSSSSTAGHNNDSSGSNTESSSEDIDASGSSSSETNNAANTSNTDSGPSGLDSGKSDVKRKTKNKGMKIARQLQEANKFRMAAFACDSPYKYPSENRVPESDPIYEISVADDAVNRREAECPPENQQPTPVVKKIKRNTLTMHVLDISGIIDGNNNNYVTWLCPRLGEMHGAPEELVMYTLVKGIGELIMFGGVHNDISFFNYTENQSLYSNSLHFITAPRDII